MLVGTMCKRAITDSPEASQHVLSIMVHKHHVYKHYIKGIVIVPISSRTLNQVIILPLKVYLSSCWKQARCGRQCYSCKDFNGITYNLLSLPLISRYK